MNEPTEVQPGPEDSASKAPTTGKGSVAATLALLRSAAFQALPKADPLEVEQRILELRAGWDSE